MEKMISLSDYASVNIINNLNDVSCSVAFTKQSYGCDPVTVTLNQDEWRSLEVQLPSITAMAKLAWDEIQAGITPSLQPVQRKLSDKYVLMLSAFAAPNGHVYVVTGIRRYFINKQGDLTPKKEGSVTLSYHELCCLAQQTDEINDLLSNCLANVKSVVIHGYEDVQEAQKLLEQFWKVGWGKCHLILNKPSTSQV